MNTKFKKIQLSGGKATRLSGGRRIQDKRKIFIVCSTQMAFMTAARG